MIDATLHELVVPIDQTSRISLYESGVLDGVECRRRAGTPSTFRLVAINDEYSAGFRAGYFQREGGKQARALKAVGSDIRGVYSTDLPAC